MMHALDAWPRAIERENRPVANPARAARAPLLPRRTFLAAAAVMPFLGSSGNALAVEDKAGQAAKCTLGFSTYGMKSLSVERAVDAVAKIGFDAIELAVREGWDSDSARLDKQRRRLLRAQLKATRLRLSSLMEHVLPLDDKGQARSLERLKLATDLAHELAPDDPPVVQTVLGGGDFEKQRDRLLDRLAEWMQLADSSKTTIAIKPHRGGVVSRPKEAIWLFDQLGQPSRLRMVYDYSHYAFRRLPLEDTIRKSLLYTAHIAIKDAVQREGRVVFDLPGAAGTIDFAQLIRLFSAGGYRGDFNCEVSGMVWGKPKYDSIAAAKICYANVSKAFQLAGVPRPKP